MQAKRSHDVSMPLEKSGKARVALEYCRRDGWRCRRHEVWPLPRGVFVSPRHSGGGESSIPAQSCSRGQIAPSSLHEAIACNCASASVLSESASSSSLLSAPIPGPLRGRFTGSMRDGRRSRFLAALACLALLGNVRLRAVARHRESGIVRRLIIGFQTGWDTKIGDGDKNNILCVYLP